MCIKEIAVCNFRILSDSKMDFDNEMCLLFEEIIRENFPAGFV